MVAGTAELQAEAHALSKDLVESVVPSGLAPKVITLYVTAFAIDWFKKTTRSVRTDLIMGCAIFLRERERERERN